MKGYRKIGAPADLQSILRDTGAEVLLVSLDIVGTDRESEGGGPGAHLKELYQGRSVLVYGKGSPHAGVVDAVIEAMRHGARGYVSAEDLDTSVFNAAPAAAPGPTPTSVQPVQRLSAREVQVIERMSEGKTNGEIGMELGIVESTVKFHNQQVFSRLKVRNRAEAVMSCLRQGHIR